MHPLVKVTLLIVIRRWFRAVDGDDFVDLFPLSTNPVASRLPRTSKTGTYSFKVTGRKRDYKLFGCISRAWADGVYQATDVLRSQQVVMPQILAKKGRYILAEWIQGKDIRNTLSPEWDDRHEAIVQYQASIHNAPNSDESCASTSYIHDFLVPRFKRHASKWLTSDQIACIDRYVEKAVQCVGRRPARFSHPDFTHFNLVQSPNGLVIVDNETLHYGTLWEYDVLNTANILFAPLGLKETYLKAYSRRVDVSSLYRHANFWEVIWLIRMAGGKLQVGDAEEGRVYVKSLIRKTGDSTEASELRAHVEH